MTRQGHDRCRYEDASWEVSAYSAREAAHPSLFGITPEPYINCNYRGYLIHYEVENRRLQLARLVVGSTLGRSDAPRIGGLAPRSEGRDLVYENQSLPLAFTGGMLLGSGPSRSSWAFSRPPWEYERLCELIFEDGRLLRSVDRSEAAIEVGRVARDLDYDALYVKGGLERVFARFELTYQPPGGAPWG
jgi:hypothetical protein